MKRREKKAHGLCDSSFPHRTGFQEYFSRRKALGIFFMAGRIADKTKNRKAIHSGTQEISLYASMFGEIFFLTADAVISQAKPKKITEVLCTNRVIQTKKPHEGAFLFGLPDRIRTCGLQSRSLSLYPAGLRVGMLFFVPFPAEHLLLYHTLPSIASVFCGNLHTFCRRGLTKYPLLLYNRPNNTLSTERIGFFLCQKRSPKSSARWSLTMT